MKDLPLSHNPKLIGVDETITTYGFCGENVVWIVTAAGVTVTLPTPEMDLVGKKQTVICYFTPGQATLSGTFVGGTSYTMDAYVTYTLACVPVANGTYKWSAQSGEAIGTGITQEQLEDYVGDMVNGGTETGIAVTYTDGTGKLNFVVAKCTGAEITTGTEDAKYATPKAIADSDIPTAIASGAEVNTGTDNAKAVTAKALADSDYAKTSDIPSAISGYDYVKTGRTGGTINDLDGIAYADLSDGHTALVMVGNNPGVGYLYVFDDDKNAVESDPTVIKPDDAGASLGRWVLASIMTLSTSVSDWQEAVEDTTGAMVATASATAHRGISATYTDGSGTLAFTNSVAKWVLPSRTGGVVGTDLDGIDGALMTNGDRALVIEPSGVGTVGRTFSYVCYEAGAPQAESDPTIIVPDTTPGNKAWILQNNTSESTAITDWAEAVSDTAGGMWTGNTETGITITYQDGDNTIDAVVSYGTTASTACEGNDARLPTTEQKTAMFDYYCTDLLGGTAGTDVDGIVTAGAATVGGETCLVFDGADPNRTALLYVFQKTGVAAESSPDVIRPDDFATDGQGNWNLALIDGACQTYGTEPPTVNTSTSGAAGTAESASRSDHSHDLGTHTHADATVGGQVALASAVSDYTAPADWTPTLVWGTATPDSMTITAKYVKIGKFVNWWLHIESADPGAAGGHLDTIAFDANTQPADVGAGNIQWPVYGYHRKDAGAADTWTTMQGWLNCTAAAAGDRLVTIKNGVVWADNEVTHVFLSGSHYTA